VAVSTHTLFSPRLDMKRLIASPSDTKDKLLERRKDLLKSISDTRYGDSMRSAQDQGDSLHVRSLRKKIKSLESEKTGVNTRLKSLRGKE